MSAVGHLPLGILAVLGKAQAAVVRHMAAAVGHLVTAVGWMAGFGERNEAGHDGVRACSTQASVPVVIGIDVLQAFRQPAEKTRRIQHMA